MFRASLFGAGIGLALISSLAFAQDFNKSRHLNSSSQSKVNKTLAKGYATNDKAAKMDNRTIVNVGSRKSGDCTVNVGTVAKGEKAPREVVVTAKEIINVCK